MNRKRMIIEGVALGILFALGFLLLARWYVGRTDKPTEADRSGPVLDLEYCNDEQTRPCIVSFGLDADENMLVNILLPDESFPDFYLKVMRGADEISYECQINADSPNNAYCIGRKLSPGEVLHLMFISTGDDILLAEGNLPIIGLEFPALNIAAATDIPPTNMLTEPPAVLEPTEPSTFIPPTKRPFQLPTPTQPAYPNPSFP